MLCDTKLIRVANQNRCQKVYACTGGGFTFVQGGLTFKFDKNSTELYCFIFQFWGAWSIVWGAKPTKAPRGDGTVANPLIHYTSMNFLIRTRPETQIY